MRGSLHSVLRRGLNDPLLALGRNNPRQQNGRRVAPKHWTILGLEGRNQHDLLLHTGSRVPWDPNAVGGPQLAFGKVGGELLGRKAEPLVSRFDRRTIVAAVGIVEPVNGQLTLDRNGLALLVVEVQPSAKSSGRWFALFGEDIVGPSDIDALGNLVVFLFKERPTRILFAVLGVF